MISCIVTVSQSEYINFIRWISDKNLMDELTICINAHFVALRKSHDC